MTDWYDPRASLVPAGGLFVAGLVIAADMAGTNAVFGSAIWIPVLFAVVPVAIGLLTYVRGRGSTGRRVRPLWLSLLALWGLVGGVVALVVALVVGLGRPPSSGPPSPAFGLLTGILTYLVPTAAFAGLYGEAGRRPRLQAVALAGAAPIIATVVLAVLVRLSW